MASPRVPLLLCTLLLSANGHPRMQDDSLDKLLIRTSSTILHTNNLLLLPANADVPALTGQSSASDQAVNYSLGVDYTLSHGMQQLELSANLGHNHFSKFSQLDYSTRNFSALWRWSLTPQLRGSLSTQRTETPNNLADGQNYTRSNLRRLGSTRVQADYAVGTQSHLLGGLTRDRRTDEVTLPGEGDYTSHSADIALRYQQSSGSALTYTLRQTTGDYQGNAAAPGNFGGRDFSQIDHEARALWSINDKSNLEAHATHLSRRHSGNPQRDYNGLDAGLRLFWDMSGKSKLLASWARTHESYLSSDVNFTRTDTLSFEPVYQISSKVAVRLAYTEARRTYVAVPDAAPGANRVDNTKNASLSLDWQPLNSLRFTASLQNARRSSTQANRGYKSTAATLSAQFTF